MSKAQLFVVTYKGDGVVLGQGTSEEVEKSDDPYIKQFVNAEPDGPVRFHFPGPPLAEDLRLAGEDR